jgi:iron(III) transport system ATP-binding protein
MASSASLTDAPGVSRPRTPRMRSAMQPSVADSASDEQVRGRELIRLYAVTKRFADLRAVDSLSFSVAEGEIFAILGPSGCGKTTTLRLLAGFEEPDAGEVWLAGERVAGGDWRPPEKRRFGIVFQDNALFPHLDVAGNVEFGLRTLSRRQRRARALELVSLLELSGLEKRYPHELSGGQQQRVALARALAPEPLVLLLDEPFSDLDAEMRGGLRMEVRELIKRLGTTAVFVTHDQEEAFLFADRIAVMDRGLLQQVGSPEDLYYRPASRFVADFIGHGNFVPGRVEEGRVASELGSLVVPGLLPEMAGGDVEVLVRPHDIALQPVDSGAVVLRVVERRFLGSEVEYLLQLPSGQEITCHLPPDSQLAPGDRVALRVNGDNLRAFPGA